MKTRTVYLVEIELEDRAKTKRYVRVNDSEGWPRCKLVGRESATQLSSPGLARLVSDAFYRDYWRQSEPGERDGYSLRRVVTLRSRS